MRPHASRPYSRRKGQNLPKPRNHGVTKEWVAALLDIERHEPRREHREAALLAVLRQMETVARGTTPAEPSQVKAWMRILRNAAHPMHAFLPTKPARRIPSWAPRHLEGPREHALVPDPVARTLYPIWKAGGNILDALDPLAMPLGGEGWGAGPRFGCPFCDYGGTSRGLHRHWMATMNVAPCEPLRTLFHDFAAHEDAERVRLPEPASAWEPATSFVYLIACPATGQVKIGMARDPNARLGQLQTGHGHELQLVATIASENPFFLENRLHRRFRHHRLKGEWFTDVPEIREVFA